MAGLSLFGKKKTAGPGIPPIERVKELSSHGFSEPEIIDVLRKEGYSPEEIDRALTEALKARISEQKEEKKEEPKLPRVEDIISKSEAQQPLQTAAETIPESYYQYSAEDYVDYIDSIVQERVSEISQKLTDISARYQLLERKISALDQEIKELVQTRFSQQKEILDKIDAFRSSIEDINTRVGGLERAFKETLPALIESVRALSDLVQRMKKEI